MNKLNLIKKHPYIFASLISSIIISFSVCLMHKNFAYGLLTFGIMSFAIVVIVSMYDNLN